MNLQEVPYWGQLLMVAGLCVVLGVIFYMFVYTGEVTTINGLKTTLETKNKEVKKYEKIEKEMKELEARIKQINEDLKLLEGLLPSEKNDVELLDFMTRFAARHDITLDNVSPERGRQAEQYDEFIIDVKTSRGRTLDFLRFFDALANKGQILHIHGLTLKRTPARRRETDRYPVTASFKISSYVYRRQLAEEEG